MLARLFLLVSIAMLSVGCSRGKSVECGGGALYLDADTAGQLRVPDDLNVPDETDALRVPGVTPSPAPEEDSGACLEFSPAFSQGDDQSDE